MSPLLASRCSRTTSHDARTACWAARLQRQCVWRPALPNLNVRAARAAGRETPSPRHARGVRCRAMPRQMRHARAPHRRPSWARLVSCHEQPGGIRYTTVNALSCLLTRGSRCAVPTGAIRQALSVRLGAELFTPFNATLGAVQEPVLREAQSGYKGVALQACTDVVKPHVRGDRVYRRHRCVLDTALPI